MNSNKTAISDYMIITVKCSNSLTYAALFTVSSPEELAVVGEFPLSTLQTNLNMSHN